MLIQARQKLVMIGDSITDCERARPVGEGLFGAIGKGYVAQVDALLMTAHPQASIRVVNMGSSGNTVRDLAARWQSDVLDLRPDWLSIMIGINDVWRQFDLPRQSEIHVQLDEYQRVLDDLVGRTKPTVRGLVLMTPFYIEPLRQALQRRKAELPSRSLSIGFESLAYLSREQDSKDTARELIAGFVNDPRESVKVAAINALGTLRDDRALPVLERFATAQKNTPVRTAAERALDAVRSGRKTPAEVGDIRREVLELQKQNRELRREFDAMKKKLEAGSPVPSPKTKR